MSKSNPEPRIVKMYDAEGLAPFLVTLASVEEGRYFFSCLAEDSDHASDQAKNSYPEDEVVSVELQEYVIYSRSEAEASGDGAGFWSNEDGWGELESATLFTQSERNALQLPLTAGSDACWALADEVEKLRS